MSSLGRRGRRTVDGLPVVAAWSCERCPRERELLCVGIRHQEQRVRSRVIEPVFDPAPSRLDEHRIVERTLETQQPHLAGVARLDRDHRQVAAPRRPQRELKTLIGLLEHELVHASHAVPPDLKRAVQLVGHQVEQVTRIGGPGQARHASGDQVGEVLSGLQVSDPKLVYLRAADVGRPCEQGAAGARLADPNVGESGPCSDRVLVQQHLFGAVVRARAQQLKIVAAGRQARAIGEPALGPGDRVLVCRWRPARGLGGERRSEPVERHAAGVVVGALGEQVFAQRRLLRVAHPRVVIADPLTVQFTDERHTRRHRWFRSFSGHTRHRPAARSSSPTRSAGSP